MERTTSGQTGATIKKPATWVTLIEGLQEALLHRYGVSEKEVMPLPDSELLRIFHQATNGHDKIRILAGTDREKLNGALEEVAISSQIRSDAFDQRKGTVVGPGVGDRVVIAKWHPTLPTEFFIFEVRAVASGEA